MIPAITAVLLATAIGWEELAAFTYEGVQPRPVTLESGRWEGAPYAPGGSSRPTVELARPVLASADLNDDGSEEAVVLLVQSSGGSGVFHHVAVVGRDGEELRQLGVAPLGDRVQIRAVAVDADLVVLDVVQAGAGDAACCPSEKAELVWELSDRGLTQVSSKVAGRLSTADLEGVEWVLERFAPDEAAPPEPAATLVVEGDRVFGTSFCNAYFGKLVETAPGEIEVRALGSSRRSCPAPANGLEHRFQGALAAVARYSFLVGRLALTTRQDPPATLVFAPRPVQR